MLLCMLIVQCSDRMGDLIRAVDASHNPVRFGMLDVAMPRIEDIGLSV